MTRFDTPHAASVQPRGDERGHLVGRRTLLVLGALATGGLAGCIVAPVPHGRGRYGDAGPGGGYPQAPVYGPVVEVPPPPPRYEVMSVAPAVGWIWIGGHWSWQLGRHVWIGGRWTAPLPGHAWVGPRWEQVGPRGWRHHGGYWRRG